MLFFELLKHVFTKVSCSFVLKPHQWHSGNAQKLEDERCPGSNPGRTCRPSRSEFSMVFSETRINAGYDPLERPPTEGTTPIGLGP